MNNCTKEIDNLYNWALENHLIRLSDDSSFGFPKDKRKILEMENTILINKIKILPNSLKEEVNDFIDFLLSKKNKK